MVSSIFKKANNVNVVAISKNNIILIAIYKNGIKKIATELAAINKYNACLKDKYPPNIFSSWLTL